MPRAKKAATAQAPEIVEEAQVLPPSAFELVPLARLRRAPENVRHTNQSVDVESLADDIAAHGLLQNLIGYAGDTSIDKAAVYIVGGGRRLQALQRLLDLGTVDGDFPVPVLLRTPAEAIDLSLSENLAKRDMNPADEFLAFEALMKPGTLSPADLAKKFGFTERYVKQRLRLAALAPEILDAMRAGKMTIDAALTYASTQDRALQLKIFQAEAKKPWGHSVQSIRSGIVNAQMTTGDALFKFVGKADYEKKGGRYEDDLFADAEAYSGCKLVDPDIIVTTVADRARFQQVRLLQEAKAAHSTTSDLLICPGFKIGRMPTAPKGYVLVERPYYRQDIPSYATLRDSAAAKGIDIVGVYGVEYNGKLVVHEQFFVPGARLAELIPPQQMAPRKTEEEWAAERRASSIRSVAAWLVARDHHKARTDDRLWWRTTRPGLGSTIEQDGLGTCYMIDISILVIEAEIEARLEDAEKEYLLQEAERAAALEAKERAAEEAESAEAAKRAELLALDPVPAVIALGELVLFRWANGCWNDERESEDADPVYQFDDLPEVMSWAEDEGALVRGHWATVDAYDAPAGDEPVAPLDVEEQAA